MDIKDPKEQVAKVIKDSARESGICAKYKLSCTEESCDKSACWKLEAEQIHSYYLAWLSGGLRQAFIRYLTVDSETKDARRKDFNQAIFIDPADKYAGGRQVFNDTDLDMVLKKFDKAVQSCKE